MNIITRKHFAVAVFSCLLAISVAGCGGGGGGTAAGSNSIGGNGNKGPFVKGANVYAYKLNADGSVPTTLVTGTNYATTTVSDDLGTYSLGKLPWSGATEIKITGQYADEYSGGIVGPDSLTSFVVLPAISPGVVSSKTVNPNIVSDAAAKLAQQTMKSAVTNGTTADPAAAIASANSTALQALGLPTTDSTGATLDPNALNVTATKTSASNTLADANTKLLVLSAAIQKTQAAAIAAAPGTAAVSTVSSLLDTMVHDMYSGNPIGTEVSTVAPAAAVTPASINTDVSSVNVATVTTNITNTVSTAITAIQATDPTYTPPTDVSTTTDAATLSTNTTTAQTTVTQTIATTLKGFALASNQFTIGGSLSTPSTYTIDPYGATTNTAGSIKSTDVVLKAHLNDYNGVATPAAGTPYSTALSFYIASTAAGDNRYVSGTLNPVVITVVNTAGTPGGATSVTASVPAGATLTYKGIPTSNGATVTGSAKNIAANSGIITSTGGNQVTVNANTLLGIITARLNKASLNVLNTVGTYKFEFGFGLNIGTESAGALTKMLPFASTLPLAGTTATIVPHVTGHVFFGNLTTVP